MSETEITQEEAPKKNRALAFINWEHEMKDGTMLKSNKGYAVFDSKEYPMTKSDAILVKAAKAAKEKGENIFLLPVTLRVVLNNESVESAEEFDLDKLDLGKEL